MTRVSATVIVMLLIQESFFRESIEIKRGVQIRFGFRFNPYIVKFLISSLKSGLFSINVLQLIYTRFHTSY